ncbi:MAG: bifunctional nuclease family protein [Chloroflexi bacterium]|nr:bifunctional nuclease family protein [Chloroflexota bacterium]
MREMVIDSIRVSLLNYSRIVILKEKDAERFLPIWIGQPEAEAIALKLQDMTPPRPMTHDLLHHVVGDLGGVVNHVVVSGLDQETFFAKIVMTAADKTIAVDSRPSDALALAVRAKVPIYAEESVLDRAGVHMDAETGKAIVGDGETTETAGTPPSQGEIERMSAFKDFIDTLDLDDIGDAAKDG